MNLHNLKIIALFLPIAFVPSQGIGAVRDITNIEVDVKQLRDAVASRTLTWLTGSSANNDYISVGRTANYFGFVGLRVASGQSLSRSDVANDTLSVLNEVQRSALVALLTEQREPFEKTQQARFRINRTLEGLLVGDIISQDSFLEMGRVYGASEAELGRVIAQRFGEVKLSLTDEQMKALSDIREIHMAGRGQNIDRQGLRLKLPQHDKKELVNLAARFLSWTTGSQEFNDFEVVGKPSQHFGFVSLRIDSNHGVKRGEIAKQVWAMMNAEQQGLLSAAATHDARVFKEFLSARAMLMRTLENSLNGKAIDAEKTTLYGAEVGEFEASMTWSQATAMIAVRNSFSESQSSQLLSMRAKYAPADADLPDDPLERGRQLFAQCALCHSVTGQQVIAPNLTGVVGRAIASDSSFKRYSSALSKFGKEAGVWNVEKLNQFLTSPKSLVPGTTMGYDGLGNYQDREAILVYLESLDDRK